MSDAAMSLKVFLYITPCHLVTSFQSTRRNISENFNNQAITVRSLFCGAVRNFCYAMPYTTIRPSAAWNVHATTPQHHRHLTIPLIHAISAQRRPPQHRTGLQMSFRCVISCMFHLGVLFCHGVIGCILSAFTFECTYLRTMLKRNDNSAILFPVSGSLLYHMQARSVIVKTRRACSRTKIKSATNSRTYLQEISFHTTGV